MAKHRLSHVVTFAGEVWTHKPNWPDHTRPLSLRPLPPVLPEHMSIAEEPT